MPLHTVEQLKTMLATRVTITAEMQAVGDRILGIMDRVYGNKQRSYYSDVELAGPNAIDIGYVWFAMGGEARESITLPFDVFVGTDAEIENCFRVRIQLAAEKKAHDEQQAKVEAEKKEREQYESLKVKYEGTP